jgi:enoyl-CoA hydratase/carnithine racemase
MDQAILGQFEVGVGAVPGGSPMARLARLVGRGRALEILLGGDDIPAALAARYGYVNRVVPDAGERPVRPRLVRAGPAAARRRRTRARRRYRAAAPAKPAPAMSSINSHQAGAA